MKTVMIVLVLFICSQTFAQQLNNNDKKLPPLILLTYPNIKDAFIGEVKEKYVIIVKQIVMAAIKKARSSCGPFLLFFAGREVFAGDQ